LPAFILLFNYPSVFAHFLDRIDEAVRLVTLLALDALAEQVVFGWRPVIVFGRQGDDSNMCRERPAFFFFLSIELLLKLYGN
jgi:hypothetical protein